MVDKEKFGEWAFIVGVFIAIVIGLFSGKLEADIKGWLVLILVLLGIVVGFLNVSEKETTAFLIAAIALLLPKGIDTALQVIPAIGPYLVGVVTQISAFVAPAAIVVALKSIYNLAAKG